MTEMDAVGEISPSAMSFLSFLRSLVIRISCSIRTTLFAR